MALFPELSAWGFRMLQGYPISCKLIALKFSMAEAA
eukprot:CAMPEP_0184383932 /NCGR_PEP_ID=MMETSP0007-20130409/7520_1 /TAXON_ID=97485 /ORGANISM="Prymnesium parvum, Strain Texoma1" /LENGTH=35 /DNA_ID= /DNA_START= /DNA_END= /DNA_ORIENTATION=